MFDAKSILETMITGGRGGQSGSQGGGLGGLGDILGQVMKQGGGGNTGGQGGMPAGLEDLVRNMMGGNSSPQTGNPQAPAATERSGQGDGGFGGLGDMMKDVMGGGSSGQQGGQSGGGIGDILGQAFGQAKDGVSEGAGKINDATGAGDAMGDLMRQFSGKSPEEMMSQLQDLIKNNKLGAGAALGGLGALVLGTQTGRSVAVSAAKIGALALIGGLAYKAYSNYQSGASAGTSGDADPQAAPQGSGFEPDAISNDDAALYIRTMLAAAAADGRVDADEQQRILGSLQQAGLDDGAEEFIADALNNPISIDEIASKVGSKEQAVQVYTAARIAIDPDTYGERAFLSDLAGRLGIEPELAAHIDAASKGAAA
ncbi:MAG: tellurite resistance TerB family protein [Pseudomonadota bacterium]